MQAHNLTRRSFLTQSIRGLGAATLAGQVATGLSLFPARANAREQVSRVRIGYLPITDAAPLLAAYALGYFKDEGLKADRPVLIRSWSALSESFLTDKFNLTHLLLPIPVWMRYNRKIPVKIMAWDHTNGSAVTVRADAGINGFADLGGKQVAIPYWYAMHNIILQMGLKKAGLKPVIQNQRAPLKPNEVNLFVLPPPDMPIALAGRKIDAFIVAEPFNAMAELKVKARIMRFTGDIWKNHPCCVVVMKENLTQAAPIFTQKAMNAVVRAQLWLQSNPAKAAQLLSRDGDNFLPVPQSVLARVFSYYDVSAYGPGNVPQAIRHPQWGIRRIGFQPYPFPSATRFIVNEMKQTLMEGDKGFLETLSPDLAVNDLVDDRFVKKALQNVGGYEKFDVVDIQSPWSREEIIEF